MGGGAYICGEKTALLDSLGDLRGRPRLRPPFPAIAGLYASPTVNNVGTIASVPYIVLGGADWWKSMGTEKLSGPMIYSCRAGSLIPVSKSADSGSPCES